MMSRVRSVACLAFLAGVAVPAAAIESRPDKTSPAKTATVAAVAREIYSTRVEIAPDTTSVRTEHYERVPLIPAAVAPLSRLTINLAGGDTYEIVEAFTRKSDGTRIPIAATDVATQSGAVGATQSFVDTKILQVAFRDVSPGDTIIATIRIKAPKPPPLGGVEAFYRVFAVPEDLDISYTVVAPPGMRVQTAASGIAYTHQTDTDGRTTHTWSAHLGPRALNEANVADPSFANPYLAYSTASTWESIGRDYWAGASSKIKLTPRIRTLAETITKDAKDPREQARRLFDWVTDNIRYVAVYMGNGPWIPNDLETILDRRYGDCKDAATLLTALLSAKGIRAEQALVTLLDDYRQFETPLRAGINHVLVYLPDLDVYADATNAYTPFGQIEPPMAGKIALFTGPDGARIGHIPVGHASQSRSEVESTLTIGPDRKMNVTTKTTTTGDFAFIVRAIAAVTEQGGSERVTTKLLETASVGGAATVKFPASTVRTETASFVASADGAGAEAIDIDGFRPTSMTMLGVETSFVFGAPTLPRINPLMCMPGMLHETIVVRPPAGVGLVKVPAPVLLRTDFADYKSTWRWQGGVLTIERELTSRVTTRACPASMVPAIHDFTRKVMSDVKRRVAFTDWPEETGVSSAPAR